MLADSWGVRPRASDRWIHRRPTYQIVPVLPGVVPGVVSGKRAGGSRAFGPASPASEGQFSFSICKKKKRMCHPIGFQERIQLAAVRGSAAVEM